MFRLPTLLALTSLTCGCALGSDYRSPMPQVATAWQATKPLAQRGDTLVGWWGRFDDAVLTELQTRAQNDSPTLDQALARITQARATLASNRSQLQPQVQGSASHSDTGARTDAGAGTAQSATTQPSGGTVGLDASWELDLFGKLRRNTAAAASRVQARRDDWAAAQVSLAAEVADDYVQYRGCVMLAEADLRQAKSQLETARLTRVSASAGFTAPADAELAEASAASLRSSYIDQRSQCDLLVKTLVSLTGSDEPELRALLAGYGAGLPAAPTLEVASVPADVVRQRPDVASSERELAASSEEIGVAIADLYPSLSLSGSLTATSSIRQWSFGPSVLAPLFDGGRRRAAVATARAAYDVSLGAYRQSVRSAVLEVEQALVRLDAALARTRDAERSERGYQANFRAVDELFRAGTASMLDRESARRNAIEAERTLAGLRTTQVRQWIALYKALGGGWQSASEPTTSTFIQP